MQGKVVSLVKNNLFSESRTCKRKTHSIPNLLEIKMEDVPALRFAHEWINAWNRHDLPSILSHYTDDFEMRSPMIAKVLGNSDGILKGKKLIGVYWAKALEMAPDLHFELLTTCSGVNSVAIQYRGVGGRIVIECFSLGKDGKATAAHAHYEET